MKTANLFGWHVATDGRAVVAKTPATSLARQAMPPNHMVIGVGGAGAWFLCRTIDPLAMDVFDFPF
jgi:hypothetical protein